jgi:D-glycero-D-manno-heptose 1,7-bisphosphate phosphatase
MNKAVFLDRDGIINKERGEYNFKPEHFIINPHILTAIALFKQNDFVVIIVSNQGGIAKGIYSNNDVLLLEKMLNKLLIDSGTYVDEFYYCPHHNEVSKCLCRKPGSLLLEKAIARFNIDSKKSYMIGDSKRDVKAAERVGVRGILVPANSDLLPLANQIVNGLI